MSISKFNNLVNIPVKFKLLQLCQVQPFFKIQFASVNGQVASSHPRTACACQFVSVNGQVASSHPRTACACRFVSAIGQAASSHPRTACTYPFGIRRAASSRPRTARASFFLSAK